MVDDVRGSLMQRQPKSAAKSEGKFICQASCSKL
jgi:hypothetical protein